MEGEEQREDLLLSILGRSSFFFVRGFDHEQSVIFLTQFFGDLIELLDAFVFGVKERQRIHLGYFYEFLIGKTKMLL
jgi:hypothetical protein